jgi:hypothetical protein
MDTWLGLRHEHWRIDDIINYIGPAFCGTCIELEIEEYLEILLLQY